MSENGSPVVRFRYVGLTASVAQILDGAWTVTRNIATDWSGAALADWAAGGSGWRRYLANGHGDLVAALAANGSVSAPCGPSPPATRHSASRAAGPTEPPPSSTREPAGTTQSSPPSRPRTPTRARSPIHPPATSTPTEEATRWTDGMWMGCSGTG